MTRPDFKAIAAEVLDLATRHGETVADLIAMKIELAYEAGRGTGLDEANSQLLDALGKLGRKPS